MGDEKKQVNNILTQRPRSPAYSESLSLRGGKEGMKLDSLEFMWVCLPRALERTGHSQGQDGPLGVNSKWEERRGKSQENVI